MAIVDELKKLIEKRGGQINGIYNIEDAVRVLGELGEISNPLAALAIDVDIGASEDLLGKYVSDLQKDVVVDAYRGEITGESKYVTGYTGFSGDTNMQKGYFLALHAEVPDVEGVTIKAKTVNMEVTLDADGILVLFLRYGDLRDVTFIAEKSGCASVTRKFDLTKLVLKEPA